MYTHSGCYDVSLYLPMSPLRSLVEEDDSEHTVLLGKKGKQGERKQMAGFSSQSDVLYWRYCVTFLTLFSYPRLECPVFGEMLKEKSSEKRVEKEAKERRKRPKDTQIFL